MWYSRQSHRGPLDVLEDVFSDPHGLCGPGPRAMRFAERELVRTGRIHTVLTAEDIDPIARDFRRVAPRLTWAAALKLAEAIVAAQHAGELDGLHAVPAQSSAPLEESRFTAFPPRVW